jgi:ParB-like chromosome segregation protein Spo0J
MNLQHQELELEGLDTPTLQEIRARLDRAKERAVLPRHYNNWLEVKAAVTVIKRVLNKRYLNSRDF